MQIWWYRAHIKTFRERYNRSSRGDGWYLRGQHSSWVKEWAATMWAQVLIVSTLGRTYNKNLWAMLQQLLAYPFQLLKRCLMHHIHTVFLMETFWSHIMSLVGILQVPWKWKEEKEPIDWSYYNNGYNELIMLLLWYWLASIHKLGITADAVCKEHINVISFQIQIEFHSLLHVGHIIEALWYSWQNLRMSLHARYVHD